jgi:glycosyltransferase involved in cell wall biosynthesis
MPEFTKVRPLRIAVDLTPLLPFGQNGGVKPFIFEYLGWLGRQRLVPVQFLLLTRRMTHADVRALARFNDEIVCVIDEPSGAAIRTETHSPRESARFGAPPDLVARLGADVLYCPFGACTWSHPGIPTLVTVVDVLHRDYPFSLSEPEIAAREAAFQEVMRIADRIQGISEHTLARVTHHYSYPRERMFCSHIAIHHRFDPSAISAPPFRAPRPYFLYPANAWKHKNHEALFLAYGLYRARAGDGAWDLFLTGHADGAMASLLGLAATLGLDRSVRFLGHLSDDRYAGVWRGAGAMVFPSLHEGFGIPLVEAMAFGLPVLSSQAGSLVEVGGDACLYVDATKPLELADAMARIAGDSGLRAELSARGRRRLGAFSFEQDARRLLGEFVACAGEPARLSRKGVSPDGWTGANASFGTPRWDGPSRLEIAIRAMPAPRTLRLSLGGNLIGQASIAAGQARILDIALRPEGRTISLEVPDALPLNPSDHRSHGVRIESMRLRDSAGAELDLLAP